ncbi:aminoglycoside phosphotransferase family protein [Fictibacillus enclensis]|nr:aminoglycoside phosphotransferase family protein [Fictibacillus enclensis]
MMNNDARSAILDRYNITRSYFLGSGMEAEVYALSDHKVLKVYNHMSDLNKQWSLKEFYAGIHSDGLSYELPYIYDVFLENGIVVTIEKRIEGSNMQSLLSDLSFNEQSTMMEIYLKAHLDLQQIKGKSTIKRFVLFDEPSLSPIKIDNWYDVLKEKIRQKQPELKPYFKRDVPDYETKLNDLMKILSKGYKGEHSLIHGDFFPGNLLMNTNSQVTGLIDFGWMTMYGDPLFDIAIGWICFDMYDELNSNIRDRYLNIILSTLGEGARKDLYFYVLVYSFIMANFYSEDCSDGHYQWCVKNINNKNYWNAV